MCDLELCFCRTLHNAVNIMNESDGESDDERFNDAMVEESDESDTSEMDDVPCCSQRMGLYLYIHAVIVCTCILQMTACLQMQLHWRP